MTGMTRAVLRMVLIADIELNDILPSLSHYDRYKNNGSAAMGMPGGAFAGAPGRAAAKPPPRPKSGNAHSS